MDVKNMEFRESGIDRMLGALVLVPTVAWVLGALFSIALQPYYA